MNAMARETNPATGLDWLLRLRWLAVAGQLGIAAFTAWSLEIRLPLAIIAAGILATALVNLLVIRFRRRVTRITALMGGLIALDTCILSFLLYHTGGAHNPLTALYLLHVTLGAILLPAWAAWSILAQCAVGFGLLFLSPHELVSLTNETCCTDMSSHLQGMWFGMLISGSGIAFFVSRLSADLARQRRALDEARQLSHRGERFAALATLAAGVAHELATPLGTIAVVSADFERMSCEVCKNGECKADARLIRGEVERCRLILEKLSDRTTDGVGDPPQAMDLREIPRLLEPFLLAAHRGRLVHQSHLLAPVAWLPQAALLQSLAVLIKNACEASAPEQPVVLRVSQNPAELCFQVKDSGCGMSPEVADRAGEAFFTTKAPGIGMGLGLFLVRAFVDRMRGRLDIQTESGLGTAITLILPREREGSAHG